MASSFGLQMPSITYPDLPPERLVDRVVELARAAERIPPARRAVVLRCQERPSSS
jgi:hypothetical protein